MTLAPDAAAGSIAASDRPWPSRRRSGHIRHDVDAEPAEGVDEDRKPGQSVRVEVAEDEHAFAAARGRAAIRARKASASGSSAGSSRAVSGAATNDARSQVAPAGPTAAR